MRSLIILLTIAACLTGCTQKKGLLSQIKGATMSEEQLTERVGELRHRFISAVESQAIVIANDVEHPAMRTDAIRWMILANEQATNATFHADPGVAFVDLAALIVQHRWFFENGAGSDVFGTHQANVVSALQTVEKEARSIGVEITNADVAEESFFYKWAIENPIDPETLFRPSSATVVSEYVKRTGGGLYGPVESVDEGVQAIARRLSLLTSQLPKQIIWRADLLIESRLRELPLEEILAEVEQVGSAVEAIPDEIDRQRGRDLRGDRPAKGRHHRADRCPAHRYRRSDRCDEGRVAPGTRPPARRHARTPRQDHPRLTRSDRSSTASTRWIDSTRPRP